MINKDEIFELTQNGAQQLNDELEKLKTVDRVKIREAKHPWRRTDAHGWTGGVQEDGKFT